MFQHVFDLQKYCNLGCKMFTTRAYDYVNLKYLDRVDKNKLDVVFNCVITTCCNGFILKGVSSLSMLPLYPKIICPDPSRPKNIEKESAIHLAGGEY